MKITKEQLKSIIKEEIQAMLKEEKALTPEEAARAEIERFMGRKVTSAKDVARRHKEREEERRKRAQAPKPPLHPSLDEPLDPEELRGMDRDSRTIRQAKMKEGAGEPFGGGNINIMPLPDEEHDAAAEQFYKLRDFLDSYVIGTVSPVASPSEKLIYALRWIASFKDRNKR